MKESKKNKIKETSLAILFYIYIYIDKCIIQLDKLYCLN